MDGAFTLAVSKHGIATGYHDELGSWVGFARSSTARTYDWAVALDSTGAPHVTPQVTWEGSNLLVSRMAPGTLVLTRVGANGESDSKAARIIETDPASRHVTAAARGTQWNAVIGKRDLVLYRTYGSDAPEVVGTLEGEVSQARLIPTRSGVVMVAASKHDAALWIAVMDQGVFRPVRHTLASPVHNLAATAAAGGAMISLLLRSRSSDLFLLSTDPTGGLMEKPHRVAQAIGLGFSDIALVWAERRCLLIASHASGAHVFDQAGESVGLLPGGGFWRVAQLGATTVVARMPSEDRSLELTRLRLADGFENLGASTITPSDGGRRDAFEGHRLIQELHRATPVQGYRDAAPSLAGTDFQCEVLAGRVPAVVRASPEAQEVTVTWEREGAEPPSLFARKFGSKFVPVPNGDPESSWQLCQRKDGQAFRLVFHSPNRWPSSTEVRQAIADAVEHLRSD